MCALSSQHGASMESGGCATSENRLAWLEVHWLVLGLRFCTVSQDLNRFAQLRDALGRSRASDLTAASSCHILLLSLTSEHPSILVVTLCFYSHLLTYISPHGFPSFALSSFTQFHRVCCSTQIPFTLPSASLPLPPREQSSGYSNYALTGHFWDLTFQYKSKQWTVGLFSQIADS